jgi:hypothetical protein
MSTAFAFLVATALDQATLQKREAARQVAADADLLLRWIKAQPEPPTLKRQAQNTPAPLRAKRRRDAAVGLLLRQGKVRRAFRGRATVLVPT